MKDLEKTEKVIQELIFDITRENFLSDISSYDNRDLLKLDGILFFACADAVIRLLGINPEISDMWIVLDEAALFAKELTPERIAKLYLQTGDEIAVVELIYHRVNRHRTQEEVLRRVTHLKYGGNRLFNFIALTNQDNLDKLLREYGSCVKAFRHNCGIGSSSLDNALRGKYFKGADDIKGKALVALYESLNELKENVKVSEIEELEPIPLSRSVNQLKWEAAKTGIMRVKLAATIQTYLPILEGTAEKIPLKMHDRFKSQRVKEGREILESGDVSSHDIDKILIDDPPRRFKRSGSKKKREGVVAAIALQETCRILISRARDPEVAKKAITMIVRGYSTAEIRAETRMSERQIREYKKQLKDVSSLDL
ncbi:MAG: hypothetical protein M0P57_08080 [Syntrophales bacterium]|jgi:hypothetical protein|nr:hypothetical protein [Syntrophales bacterium]MDY0045603.1 hypothetical protein [Syntrophales bacterium]